MADMTPKQAVLSIPPQWRGRMNKAIRAAVQAEREAIAKWHDEMAIELEDIARTIGKPMASTVTTMRAGVSSKP